MARRNEEPEVDEFSIPVRSASEQERLNWGNTVISRGLAFIRSQPAYPDIKKGRELVHSLETYDEAIPDKLSHVRVPRIKRQIREIVATLSNLRPTWDYVSNNPKLYEDQANVLNKLNRAWYYNEEVDRSIRRALQYSATEGTGYLYITVEKSERSTNMRIKLTPLGADSYLPFQQSLDNQIQNAEVGIVCTEIPVQKARRIYNLPHLQPTNNTATNLVKGGVLEMITNVLSPYLRASGPNRRRNSEGTNTPTVNIYHLYIKDPAVNRTGEPIKMGNFDGERPLDNFSYIVPYIGQPIPTGRMIPEYDDDGVARINDLTGDPTLVEETREAGPDDCLLYPNLRLIIMSPLEIIYDGPSMFWHGRIPIVQFKLDDWPWNFLGFSLARDTWRLEESINSRLRARDDAMNARLNPALMYDSRMAETFDEKFTPRIPGGRIVKYPMVDKPIESVLPVNFYDVGPNVDAEIMQDEKRLDFLMGVSEIDNILNLKQIPQSDSLDKLIGAASALRIDQARNMEGSLRQLGELFKALAFQYYTTRERFQLLGEDGITVQDFDFDPGNMIPSHLPGEDVTKESRATKSERARAHIDTFRFNVIPNSLTQITAITRKMLYMQIWRDKTFPMDPWTFAEEMELSNLGPPPTGAGNMIEKWQSWMKTYTDSMKEIMQGQVTDMGNIMGGNREGRPPSGHAPPHFEKGGATIAES